MGCCVVSNSGNDVIINTCCDDNGSVSPSDYNSVFGAGTGIDGGWSDNAKLSEQGNLLVDYTCIENGDLFVKWATKTPTDTNLSIDGYAVTPNGVNSHTIDSYDATSLVIVAIDNTDEYVTIFPTACQVIGSYTFTSACWVDPLGNDKILLSWTTKEFIYLYRENDNKLILQSDSLTEYADNNPLWGTNTYILSSTPLSEGITELARVSHDFNTCLTPCDYPSVDSATGGVIPYSDRPLLISTGAITTVTMTDVDNSIWYAVPNPSPSDNTATVRLYRDGNDAIPKQDYSFEILASRKVEGVGIEFDVKVIEPEAGTNQLAYPRTVAMSVLICDNT